MLLMGTMHLNYFFSFDDKQKKICKSVFVHFTFFLSGEANYYKTLLLVIHTLEYRKLGERFMLVKNFTARSMDI